MPKHFYSLLITWLCTSVNILIKADYDSFNDKLCEARSINSQ